MAKEDVLDTVDIFFGAGKSTAEAETQQQSADSGRTRSRGRRVAADRAESDGSQGAPTASAAQVGGAGVRGGYPYGGRGVAAQPGVVESELPDRERISFVLPTAQVEFLKNYKYCRALMDGDPQYTLTEALIEAIELLRQYSGYEVFERPDFVRAREKKPRKR